MRAGVCDIRDLRRSACGRARIAWTSADNLDVAKEKEARRETPRPGWDEWCVPVSAGDDLPARRSHERCGAIPASDVYVPARAIIDGRTRRPAAQRPSRPPRPPGTVLENAESSGDARYIVNRPREFFWRESDKSQMRGRRGGAAGTVLENARPRGNAHSNVRPPSPGRGGWALRPLSRAPAQGLSNTITLETKARPSL